MKITDFIESVEELGCSCEVTKGSITVYRPYGEKLRKKAKIGRVYLVAANQFEMFLDPSSANDGLGELIAEFGMTSLRTRGRVANHMTIGGVKRVFNIK